MCLFLTREGAELFTGNSSGNTITHSRKVAAPDIETDSSPKLREQKRSGGSRALLDWVAWKRRDGMARRCKVPGAKLAGLRQQQQLGGLGMEY